MQDISKQTTRPPATRLGTIRMLGYLSPAESDL